jgi:hypothetical protein
MAILEDIFCGRLQKTQRQLETDVGIKEATIAALNERLVAAAANYSSLLAEKNKVIELAAADKQESLKALTNVSKMLEDATQELSDAQLAFNSCIAAKPAVTEFDLLPLNTKTILALYMDKYPEANIKYRGRVWGKAQTAYDLDVKVWLQSGQNDVAILKRVTDARASVQYILKENPQLSLHQACDVAIMRVAAAFWKPYMYDSDSWGQNEYWQFASEMEIGNGGDCDDSAIWRYVGWRAAGIPYQMLRFVAGVAYNGQGHATNYYFASDLKWHHINSTSAWGNTDDVKNTPLNGDANEQLNIQTVWFSANEAKTFSTYAAYTGSNGVPDKFKMGEL